MSALWSVRFVEVSGLERLRCKIFLRIRSGKVHLIEVFALKDVCSREVPL